MYFSESFTKSPSQSTFANPAGTKLVDLRGWYRGFCVCLRMFGLLVDDEKPEEPRRELSHCLVCFSPANTQTAKTLRRIPMNEARRLALNHQPRVKLIRAFSTLVLLCWCAVASWSQITTTFVGISLNNPTDYPTASPQFGLLRLWDTPNTSWPSLQPTAGANLTTTALDEALNGACINSPGYVAGTTCGNAVVMYTFGRVPSWASANSSDSSCAYGNGQCQPPSCSNGSGTCTHLNADGSGDDASWRSFLVLLGQHLNGLSSTQYAPVKYFEVWNEIDRSRTLTNNTGATNVSYNGSFAQLLRLNEDMRCVLVGTGTIHNYPSVNSSTACSATGWTTGVLNNKTGVKFLSPSSHAQGTSGGIATSIGVVQNFLYCSNSSLPRPNCNWQGSGTGANWGSASVDYINFHMKPGNERGTCCTWTDPEIEMQNEYNSAKSILTSVNNDNTKPFWNGESGYSGASPCGWTPNPTTGDVDLNSEPVEQAAFTARYMLMQWSIGIQASAWYQYDLSNFLVGSCSGGTYTNNGVITDAYTASNNVAVWMIGSTMSAISGSGAGCQIVGDASHPTLWGCQLKRGTWTGQVYWDSNTTFSCTGSTDASCNTYNYTSYPSTPVWHKSQTADGAVVAFSNGTAIKVSNLPTIIMTSNPPPS